MPDDIPKLPSRAVFLSYSREDAEAARRIADALRAFGMEVWFDQAELRGGDSWDAKIKRQIRECALFLPIISGHTQARMEGYFRREWKLGVERTHDMAAGVAFITPVVIDDTPETAALVPDEFMRYQWTRLQHGVPTPDFVGQVKKLLESPHKAVAAPSASRSATGSFPPQASPASSRGLTGKSWGAVTAIVVAIITALYVANKPMPKVATAAPPATAASAPTAAAVDDKSIAVLPFDNMSEEKDASAFFADGVQEDILTNLSFIHGLRVVSRTSVMQYRGTIKPIRQIAQELGVAYVLEGSVRRSGNKVRVTGQLIHAATDEHVWAQAYDRDITDVFAIQSELAQSIAGALQAAISPEEKSLLDSKPTLVPAAYDLYLKARAAYEANGFDFPKQISWLLDAVQLDPNFAQAWALLGADEAGAYFNEVDWSPGMLEKAKAAIDTAVRIAPNDPFVIEMQGDFYYYGFRDYASAAKLYSRLLELRPNSSEAIGSLGLIARRQGHWPDAVSNLRRALELDPHNGRYAASLAQHYFGMRQFDLAIAEQKRVAEIKGDDPLMSYLVAAGSYFITGSKDMVAVWLAHLTPGTENDPAVIETRKAWARLTGDYAEALRLDDQQPFFDGYDVPRWEQDFNTACDHIGNGDLVTARARLARLLPQLKATLVDQPKSSTLWGVLGQTEAILGDRFGALAAAAKLTELLPESADAVAGPVNSLSRAEILAWAGEKDQAISEVARLLNTPYGEMVAPARTDPGLVPLRDDPRFQALLADPKNNAPLN